MSKVILDQIVQQSITYLQKQEFDALTPLLEQVSKNNPYPVLTRKHVMWNEQIGLNLPMLWLASLELFLFARKLKIKTLLFVTRDCGHWYKIFQALFPDEGFIVHYFQSSRIMFEQGGKMHNPHYKRYIDSLTRGGQVDKTIYVDVHGTGKHMIEYFGNEYKKIPACFLLTVGASSYKEMPPECKNLWMQGRLKALCFKVAGSPTEMLNYQPYGSVINYTEKGVVRAEAEYDINRLKPYMQCVQMFVRLIETTPTTSIPTERIIEALNYLSLRIQDRKNQPIISRWITHVKKHSRVLDLQTGTTKNGSFGKKLGVGAKLGGKVGGKVGNKGKEKNKDKLKKKQKTEKK